MSRRVEPLRPPSRAAERASALATATAGLVCLVALAGAGRTLPFPTDLRPGELLRWVDRVGTATAAFTGLRAIAVVLLAWCLTTGAAGLVARWCRSVRAVQVLDRVTLPSVRRLADAVAGLGAAAALLPAVGTAAGATPRPAAAAAVVMVDLGPSLADLAPSMVDLGPSMVDLGPAPDTAPQLTGPPTADLTPPADPVPVGGEDPPVPAPPPAPAGTWRVRPGDTLWHVAEATASEALGRPATPAEVAARLDTLVGLNADRLVVPGDPSLVFPGQELLLP